MQICLLGCLGAAGVDHYKLGSAPFARGLDPLPDHRMAPRSVRTDQQDQVRFIEIVISARHHVLAERTVMRSDCARHAQPRIGVDIATADEAFHQLVGDVIIFGEQLTRHIEGDAVRPVLGDAGLHPFRNLVQRVVITGGLFFQQGCHAVTTGHQCAAFLAQLGHTLTRIGP